MGRNYNRFRRFCAFIIGAVFFVSGILKLLDPVGTGLVISEYYRFFGTGFLISAAKPAGVALAMTEALLGAALMTGLWRRITAILSIIMICGFTVITVILVIFNPEMDCGCFGEAVHLTHFQSLVKNIVLCALAVAAFTPIGRLGRPKRRKYVSFAIVAASVLGFCIYSLMYIPLVDFTDFKASSRLAASARDSQDMYDAVFTYEKDGVRETFTLDNLPDSTWTYVSTETVKSEDSADGSYPALSITDANGEYRDNIAVNGKVLAISVYDPESMSGTKWESAASLIPAAIDAGYYPVVLSAGNFGMLAASLAAKTDSNTAQAILQSAYYADYKTLVTLNRSNGGATYFHNGYLIRKWSARNLPGSADLEKTAIDHADETVAETTTAGHLAFQAFLLYTFAIILFV